MRWEMHCAMAATRTLSVQLAVHASMPNVLPSHNTNTRWTELAEMVYRCHCSILLGLSLYYIYIYTYIYIYIYKNWSSSNRHADWACRHPDHSLHRTRLFFGRLTIYTVWMVVIPSFFSLSAENDQRSWIWHGRVRARECVTPGGQWWHRQTLAAAAAAAATLSLLQLTMARRGDVESNDLPGELSDLLLGRTSIGWPVPVKRPSHTVAADHTQTDMHAVALSDWTPL